jgi:hypothetical protein
MILSGSQAGAASSPMRIMHRRRLDALAADGTVSIQFTFTWEDNRLRMGTGAVVCPTA